MMLGDSENQEYVQSEVSDDDDMDFAMAREDIDNEV